MAEDAQPEWTPGMDAWDPNNEHCRVLEVLDADPDPRRWSDKKGPWLKVQWDDGVIRTLNASVFATKPDPITKVD
jgi:hypothetical protein